MKLNLLILLISCSYISTTMTEANVHNKNLKLELVQVLLRHGARTPEQAELDICNITLASFYEPLGLGQLTHKGKQQEYQFGRFLRTRYNHYLRPFYKLEDVYAFASAIPRTQMSLQLVLAGLYPVEGPIVWNSNLHWSPIPYLTIPKKLNILLESHKSPKFKTLKNRAIESEEFKNKFAKFSKFFEFVAKRTLIEDNNILSNVDSTFDVLIANENMNLYLPPWYTPKVKQQFIAVEDLIRDAYVATPELRKLGPGPLIKTFVQNMNLDGLFKNPRKIYLYSAHDTNIAMFTRAHNISEFRYPPFGSAVILEKLRDESNQVYVRLLAWDGAGELITLKLGNHEELCPIEDYLQIVQDVIPSDKEIDVMIGDFTAKKIKKIFFEDDEVTTK